MCKISDRIIVGDGGYVGASYNPLLVQWRGVEVVGGGGGEC